MFRATSALLLSVALLSAPALAKDRVPSAPSPLVGSLAACRGLGDSAQRLACFDKAAANLVAATQSGEVSVVDRGQVRQVRRSLFGFGSLKVPFLNDDDGESDEIKTTVRSARSIGGGKFRIVLADGNAVWETTESYVNFDDPEPGQEIVIKRGPLGSYLLRIDGQRGLKGRRVG
ncbi:hypothetical protein ACFQPG_01660 [Sphingomonas sp. GCM10030256]|uniref:hypothetical protein n=1 Tax=Sphingomonas sp. GCM10030256 TaxID=3273427 RepID=UPI0036239A78